MSIKKLPARRYHHTPRILWSKRIKNLTGKIFGRLTVESLTFARAPDGSAVWNCVCSCGNLKTVSTANLRSGSTKSCGCFAKLQYEEKGHRYQEISGGYWFSLKRKAVKVNREFTLTMREAWEIFENQNRKCALSGVTLVFAPSSYPDDKSKQTASLDRIDSKGGYCKGNVQWVHKDVNFMKQDHADDEFIQWCKTIAAYQNNKEKV